MSVADGETTEYVAHEEFHGRLAGIYTDLTPAELKICSLIRASLSTKDIAALLYISDRTVEVHRRRIRRKLGLDAGASLTNALLRL